MKVGGQRIKPSRGVQIGEIITALTGGVHRTVKVLGLLEQRVGPPRVSAFLEDLTPPEEYARAREEALSAPVRYPKGFGRPTKKQRRQLQGFFSA